jgi:hypothetical protein
VLAARRARGRKKLSAGLVRRSFGRCPAVRVSMKTLRKEP